MQFAGHGADRAELTCDVEAGERLEPRGKTCDQALGRAAAQDAQSRHELNSIVGIRLSLIVRSSCTFGTRISVEEIA